ncbi:amino acid adenylation domain-containing protein [Pseudonocardia sp. NPDC049635]|uniref:amino acid adenylation domain-containing protein n=1 Tax=Pseudonocardia sp. NPDC049635 TaxID=3155506 RepID=UPI0033C80117
MTEHIHTGPSHDTGHERTDECTTDGLAAEVAALLEVDAGELTEDDDLFELGLESLTVIRFAAARRRIGIEISFEDLALEPTLRAWRALLAERSPGSRPLLSGPVGPSGPSGPADEAFGLAPMQLAYWVGRQDGQPYGGVGSHFYLEFDGSGVRHDRLQEAFDALVARHPMLRARFDDDGRQRITERTGLPAVALHDLRRLDDTSPALHELRERWAHRRLDPGRGEVVELGLSLLPEGGTRVHLDLDMMVADARSMSVLLTDLAALYRGDEPEPLRYDFRRYLDEHAPARERDRERDRGWWAERIPELPEGPRLPTTPQAGAPGRAARMVRHHHLLPPDTAAALTAAARSRGLTPAAVLAAAFAEIVGAWSAEPRFLLNLPLFERAPLHPDVDRLVGDFTGSVLLDVDTTTDRPLTAQAREVQSRLHAAVGHGAYGGIDVLRDLSRRTGEPVLAPVVYTSALGVGPVYDETVRATFGDACWVSSQNPQVWLDAQVREQPGGVLLNWDVRADVLGDTVPAQMFAAYRDLVLGLAGAEPQTWDRPVGPLIPAEAATVRRHANATGPGCPRRALHAAFFELARTRPERPAVLRDDVVVGYGELAGRALRVAGALRERGVQPGEAVVVSLPRGVDQVVAVLGVLAAGACYVPVAADQPARRWTRIARGAGARAILGAPPHGAEHGEIPVLTVQQACGGDPLPGPVPVSPDDLAYLLFTSGSTGTPKGVEVSHAAAANTVDALGERFGVDEHDRVLLVSALEFDLSVYDLFGPLSAGGAVVPLHDAERRDPVRWWDLVRRHGVSIWNTVPVLLDMLLTAAGPEPGPIPIRVVLLGGDRVPVELTTRLHAIAPRARVAGLGGMTEAAIHSTVQEVSPGDTFPDGAAVPWGVPLPGVRCRVVDSRERDRPDLVPGEIWVGGASVARGYRGDPERTTDRFVHRDGTRWYRTGDIGFYHPGGVLDFLGRADDQVKIRGHRIEPGEVEAALASHPGVRRAVVVVVGDATRRLAAAVLAHHPAPDPDELVTHQRGRLPDAMVCETVRVLDALPLTGNGKPDRAALRALLGTAADDDRVGEPPRGPVEQRLAAVWSELLGLGPGHGTVRRDDTFFGLGGDSLLATRLVADLPAAGLHGCRLGTLFTTPALRDVAATLTLDDQVGPTIGTRIVPDPAARHEPFPGTDVQNAYRLGRDPRFTLGGVGTWQYAEFDGVDVDLDRMERAWLRLVDRHEMLRAVVDPDGRQRILPDPPRYRIEVLDVVDDGPVAGRAALEGLRDRCSHRLLDLSRWPLFELSAVRYRGADGAVRTRLAVGLDYILFDALSIMTLFTELDRLYADPGRELPPIGLSFRDYVLQVHPDPRAVADAERHWRERLDTLPEPPRLPLRVDPSQIERPRFTRRRRELSAPQWQALTATAARHGLTPSTVLLAAYAEVLGAWSANPAVTVTLTLFNRRPVHPDVLRVLGDFTSLTLADHHPAPDGDWLRAARELQHRLGADLDHRDVSPSWLLRELAARTGTLDSAVPVVFTSALGVGDRADPVSMEMSPTFPERVWGISQSPQVSLDNQVLESAGRLQVTWDSVDELFHDGVLDAMFEAYWTLLEHLAGADWSASLPDLVPPSQRTVRDRLNGVPPVLTDGVLHRPFLDRAADRADAPAVIWEERPGEPRRLSHAELARTALRLAAGLVERGIRPGDPVAITLPKGPDQIVAVLGVLAAGAVYVPVGVEAPQRRHTQVHETAGVRLVLTGIGPLLADDPLEAPVPVGPDDPAYVIFTSGSTGAPKGVQVRHGAAANTVADVVARHGIGSTDRVLGVSALDFDLSVFDVFGLLGAGGALVLPAEDERRDAARWRELCRTHGVTVWNTVPVLLEMLLVAGLPESLRLALVSGDWVPVDLPGRLAAAGAGRVRLIVMGGATEASIWSNEFDASRIDPAWSSVPYGSPLAGQRYRVVDPAGRDRPDRVPGELWIGGIGVADGYRGDPARTAERFVEHAGQRWYRTGDLGRYWPDGTLEFLGRADEQVKIAGHRLELGEVEAALVDHPLVRQAAVVAVGERTARRLHAFLVGAEPTDLDTFLAHRLAPHAIPARCTVVEALPLTANGKVDRAALAEAAGRGQGPPGGAPPAGPLELALARLWAEVLDLPGEVPLPDRDIAFFTVGGSSLSALQLLAEVSDRFGVDVPARRFLAAPTVSALAAEIAAALPDEEIGTV